MRVIRVTVDHRAEGIRVELAMSPSVLDDLVEAFHDRGSVRFNADDDLVLELDLEIRELEPEDEMARVEFAREAEDYVPVVEEE